MTRAAFLRSLPATLSPGRRFLIMAPGRWGAGATAAEAFANLKKEGGDLRHLIALDVQDDLRIDGMGDFVYTNLPGVEPYVRLGDWQGRR